MSMRSSRRLLLLCLLAVLPSSCRSVSPAREVVMAESPTEMSLRSAQGEVPDHVPDQVPVDRSAALPVRWQAWTLFEVDGQFVYAVDADDAEATAALARAAHDDFRARTGREPSNRLLLVADHDLWLPDGDPCRRLELAHEGDAALHPRRDADSDGDADAEAADLAPASCEELTAQARDMDVDPRQILCLIAHPVRVKRCVDDFGLPADAQAAWDWVVLLPAEDCVDDGMEAVMSGAMQQELSFVERLLAAPVMPFIRSTAVEVTLSSQKLLLFELHAAAQADWSEAQRERLARDYEDALERGVDEGVPAAVDDATP